MNKNRKEKIEVDETTSIGTYGYIEYKALRFLKVGHEKYTTGDAFGQPGKNLTSKTLRLLKSGCEQIRDHRGLTAETSFVGLDIG